MRDAIFIDQTLSVISPGTCLLSSILLAFRRRFVMSQLLNPNKFIALHDSTEVEAVYDPARKVYEARCPRCAMIVRLTKNANPHALNAHYHGRACDNALRKLPQLQEQGEASRTRAACFPRESQRLEVSTGEH